MLEIRKSNDRGHAFHGWLDSYHSFSFADYYDPDFMGFRSLRVINEDRLAGGGGFPPHPHRDMEIITYMIEGELEHEDSMGNREVIRKGEVQRMTAGTGVVHSEFNRSKEDLCHLLQIWIIPDTRDHRPGYAQKNFTHELNAHSLVLAVSPDGREESISIHADVFLYMGKMQEREELFFSLKENRHAWIQLVKGELLVNELKLAPGDGLKISDTMELKFYSQGPSEFLLFDLA